MKHLIISCHKNNYLFQVSLLSIFFPTPHNYERSLIITRNLDFCKSGPVLFFRQENSYLFVVRIPDVRTVSAAADQLIVVELPIRDVLFDIFYETRSVFPVASGGFEVGM